MSAMVTIYPQVPRYGASELKQVYHRYFGIAMAIAVCVHIAIIGSYYITELFQEPEPPYVKVKIRGPNEFPPSPPTDPNAKPPTVSPKLPIKPTVGAPVPVPDAEADTTKTIAAQNEFPFTEAAPGVEGGGGYEYVPDIAVEEDGPPPDFVPYEKGPEIVKRVAPQYPELALRAGLEGIVNVKLWVDREGKVRKVVVLKSTAEIFNDAAIAAAQQFVFTPAVMNQGAVAVWVSLPFRFKLTEKK